MEKLFMSLKVFQTLEFINNRLANIEKNIARIDEKLDFSIALHRNHLIRIKNKSPISDNMILMGRPYNDFSPEEAYSIYSNPDLDFIILDVSENENTNALKIKEAISIPLSQLARRHTEIQTKITPLLIICENGLNSIKACELLVKRGYFNVNNISGGHEFWPGHNRFTQREKEAS